MTNEMNETNEVTEVTQEITHKFDPNTNTICVYRDGGLIKVVNLPDKKEVGQAKSSERTGVFYENGVGFEDAEFVNRPVKKEDIEFIPKKKPKIVAPKDRRLFVVNGVHFLMPKDMKKVIHRVEMCRYQYYFSCAKCMCWNMYKSIKTLFGLNGKNSNAKS